MKTISFDNFNSAFTLMQVFDTEKKCIRYLESKLWENGKPVSPYDPTSKVYRRGDGMYRCKNTSKNFNIRIGTLFEGSKISLRKWFYAIYMVTCHTKGISSVQLSKDIHVTQKTAWFMTHRIREAFKQNYKEKFDGEVELDETFVGGKNKNRHWNKKAKKCQGRAFVDKVPVMGILQRGGKVFCKVVENTSYKQLTPPVLCKVKHSATIYSDEWHGYRLISKVYKHHVVDHDTASMLVVAHIRTRLKPFGEIIASVLSMAYTTGLAVNTCKDTLTSFVSVIILATFLLMNALRRLFCIARVD